MIPREAKRGASFQGAGLYYLHDKNAQTKERVAFTHTENLPTDDAEFGLYVMATTATSADELKRQAGVARSGRKASKQVYCFSLSWHPEETPDREHMIETGRSALAALGLQEHETVMVAHNDEAYSHLHLIVNLVNPEHGKMHTLQYSRRRLSTWAEAYEREHSQKIYCEQRVANNKRREQGEYVKYEDPELDQKTLVTKLYQAADNGKALQAALAEAGLTLAKGRRLVVVDKDGDIHSLSRQVEGVGQGALRKFLAGVELPDVDEVRRRQEEEQRKQETQQRAVRPPETPNAKARSDQQDGQDGRGEAGDTRAQAAPGKRRFTPHYSILNSMQNRQRDELLNFSWETASAAQSQLACELGRLHGEDARRLQTGIALLLQTQRERGRLSAEEADRLDTLRHDLAQLEARQHAAERALHERLRAQEEALKTRHAQERAAVYRGESLPKTANEKAFERAAAAPSTPPPVHDDPARNAFLDRLEQDQQRSLAHEWRASQAQTSGRELTPAFAAAATNGTTEDEDRDAFLDRLQDPARAHEVAPSPSSSAPEVEDEYATSLSAEFDAAGGAGYGADAARDAFLDRMGGPGLGQGMSLGHE